MNANVVALIAADKFLQYKKFSAQITEPYLLAGAAAGGWPALWCAPGRAAGGTAPRGGRALFLLPFSRPSPSAKQAPLKLPPGGPWTTSPTASAPGSSARASSRPPPSTFSSSCASPAPLRPSRFLPSPAASARARRSLSAP